MVNEDYFPYDPINNGIVDSLIKEGNRQGLREFGVELLVERYEGDDCQSWALKQLGLPEYANMRLNRAIILAIGFEETKQPEEGDLVVYFQGDIGTYHFGIYHKGNRIKSKLGVWGAVCIHPWEAFAGTSVPEFFKRKNPILFPASSHPKA